MKKIIILTLLGLSLTSCSVLRVHKIDVIQGNVIEQEDVSRLHSGMTEEDVKDIMGNPVVVNLFTPNRVDYVYSVKEGHAKTQITRVTCIFINGRLREIRRE